MMQRAARKNASPSLLVGDWLCYNSFTASAGADVDDSSTSGPLTTTVPPPTLPPLCSCASDDSLPFTSRARPCVGARRLGGEGRWEGASQLLPEHRGLGAAATQPLRPPPPPPLKSQALPPPPPLPPSSFAASSPVAPPRRSVAAVFTFVPATGQRGDAEAAGPATLAGAAPPPARVLRGRGRRSSLSTYERYR